MPSLEKYHKMLNQSPRKYSMEDAQLIKDFLELLATIQIKNQQRENENDHNSNSLYKS